MEIKKNESLPEELNNYIKIYDNILPEEVMKNFYKICKEHGNFKNKGKIVSYAGEDNTINTEIRDTFCWNLKNLDEESKTTVHWCNLLINLFSEKIKEYAKNVSEQGISCRIQDIQVLKYEKKGHYDFHVDHGTSTPRTLSCIFFINDDYKGGDLMFKTPVGNKQLKIDKKINRLIIWPSNFLYPHAVLPVTEGIRYSVVTWAL